MDITVDKIKQVLAKLLNEEVLQVEQILKGENNFAYKVETNKAKYLMRIPKHSRLGLDAKLAHIESKLQEHDIAHAKLLYHTTDSTDFPLGWMLFKFIEGENAHDAIISGHITLEQFHEKLGALLKQVHEISFPLFGDIANGKGTHKDFIQHNLDQTKEILGKMQKAKLFEEGINSAVEQVISGLIPFQGRLKPVLVHTDAEPANCIWTTDGNIVLIDWDNALATTWVVDYAELTYTGSHLTELGSREERRLRIKQSFLKGYGSIEFSEQELNTIEYVLHVIKAVNSLDYYYFVQNNTEWVNKNKERLLSLLST